MEKQQISIAMPEIASSKYKNHVKDIEELVRGLNGFTCNLQDKVNTMLKGQETEFVNSYKQHMHKIEEALKGYQIRIEEFQKKIQHYENEGILSTLLKKIQFLQSNQRKLFQSIEKKDRIALVLKGEIATQKREICSLNEKIKDLMRTKSSLAKQEYPQPTFATQMHSIDKNTLRSNQSIQQLHKYETLCNPEKNESFYEKTEVRKINRQLETLKKRNRQLSSVNSKIIERATSLEDFFVKIVNDLKRKIRGRKKFNQCSFEDFKQQDKLELLVKILSNEDILQHLYNKIFKKGAPIEGEWALGGEILRSERVFPSINSNMR